jgi:hypothetical protein
MTERRDALIGELALDAVGSEIFASDVVKMKAAANSSGPGTPIKLTTRGRGLSVSVGPQAAGDAGRASPVPASAVRQLQQRLGLSTRKMKLTAQFIRAWKGRRTFEPNLTRRLQQLDRELDEFYQVAEVPFDADGCKQTRAVVYCADPFSLIDKVIEHRCVTAGHYFVKVVEAGGGGFLKVCASITATADPQNSCPDLSTATPPTPNKSLIQVSDSGVNKLIVLAIVENVMETYDNLQEVLCLIHLQELAFCTAVDMKMANIILGLQCCSSSHPCPWCDCCKNAFASQSRVIRLRTFGDIRRSAREYQRAASQTPGTSKMSAVQFKNCVRQPLLTLPDDATVLEAVPPMELHLLLGIVNRLFEELEIRLNSLLDCQQFVSSWLNELGLRRPQHRRDSFNGNQCERLLNGVDCLQRSLEKRSNFPGIAVCHALRCFSAVKSSCFGMELRPDFENAIAAFQKAYTDLGIAVTPKVHAVFDHVAPFLRAKNRSAEHQRGLGYWSEHVMEAAHCDFSRMWSSGYKVDPSKPEYPERLRRCVVAYSSRHM